MKKRRSGRIILLLSAVFLLSTLSAHADLFNRGTDSNGYRLIYDSDLDITWYDYTRIPEGPINDGPNSNDDWYSAKDWASGLSVNFGGSFYNDWRLPETVDGPYVLGVDGTTTAGYNITSSEMGHLFYADLGNEGYFDTSGNETDCGSEGVWNCLTNTGDFQHLIPYEYWSDTEFSYGWAGMAWKFDFNSGDNYPHDAEGSPGYWVGAAAIAVRNGDVPQLAVVPEPISSILFLTGGATLIGRIFIRRKKEV